jgi:primase-polymerase (primpol)-like protein
MLGGGLGCYDLDHCLDGDELSETAAKILAAVDPLWVERSMSGTGLHVFVDAGEGPGYRRDGVEFYSAGRFIAVTGNRYGSPHVSTQAASSGRR